MDRTSDISRVIQEIIRKRSGEPNPADGAIVEQTSVNLSWTRGWASGNALALIISDNPDDPSVGLRCAESWDGSAADAALLHIEFTPGEEITITHDVYFGLDKTTVENADSSDITGIYRGRQVGTTYAPPGALEWGTGPYYWRIDEINTDGTLTAGVLWSFTITDHLIVEDFESYTDDDMAGQAIWQAWIDGFGVIDNGAQVGYLLPPYAERTIVHGGGQSMPFLYDNTTGVGNSEAEFALTALRDWTAYDVSELSIWFRGYPGSVGSFVEAPTGTYTMTGSVSGQWSHQDIGITSNAADPLYVAVSNASGAPAIVAHDDPAAATINTWTEWVVPLQAFADQGINLTNVDRIAIGLGTKGNAAASGGSGTMFFDDIGLYRARNNVSP